MPYKSRAPSQDYELSIEDICCSSGLIKMSWRQLQNSNRMKEQKTEETAATGAITGQKRDDREFRLRMMSRTPSGDNELSKKDILTHKDVLVPATKFQQDEELKAEETAATGTITGQKWDDREFRFRMMSRTPSFRR